MISSKKKFLKKVLKVSAIVIIVFIAVSMVATKFVYDSVFERYSSANDPLSYYESYKTQVTSFSYPCKSYKLAGYLYKSSQVTSELIVLVPGFHAESSEYAGLAEAFADRGFDVFCFDSTGHGESEGKSAVGFPQIINDLNATLDFIGSNKDFDYDNIFLFGHSRGGYGACCVLNEHNNICAAVSVNGVDTAMDGIMAYSVDAVGSIAYGNYPFLWAYQSMLFGTDVSGRSAVEEINESQVPVLVIQAKNDEEITKDGFSLYAHRSEINSDRVEFVLYDTPNYDGHTTILFDHSGSVNMDIVDSAVEFFKSNSDKMGEEV